MFTVEIWKSSVKGVVELKMWFSVVATLLNVLVGVGMSDRVLTQRKNNVFMTFLNTRMFKHGVNVSVFSIGFKVQFPCPPETHKYFEQG